jgi:hypothetical protein
MQTDKHRKCRLKEMDRMAAPPKKTSTRAVLPSEKNVAIVCKVGKDLGGPTDEVGIFAKLLNSIINKIRALSN